MFTILFTFFPRTFAGCSWPASVRWKEYGGGGHLCLLSHETSQIGLKIVISRVVNKTRTRGRGRGRRLFFFFLKNAVFSRFIDCVAWRCCRTHYWAAKPQKHARSARERAAKPQFPHSFTALSHLFFARPTKTAILRRLRDLHQQCIFYKNKLQWSTLHVVKSKQI